MSRRETGPSRATVELVVARDEDCCVVCGKPVSGMRGWDWSVQHRLRRGKGGTRREWINWPSNLVTMHGHGTSGCHGRVESHRDWAREHGWAVDDGITRPAAVRMLHRPLGLWVLLRDDGSWSPAPGEAACA